MGTHLLSTLRILITVIRMGSPGTGERRVWWSGKNAHTHVTVH